MSIDAAKFATALGSEKETVGSEQVSKQDGSAAVGAKDTSINTTKLRKQMKALKKEVEKSPVLEKPISGRKRKKQEQAANYEINKKKLSVYLPQVKRNREQV